MLKELLEALNSAEKKEVRVGVIVGELLDDWQRFQCDKAVLSHELDAKKSAFALEFLRRNIVDGKLNISVDQFARAASEAFFKEHADFIADHKRRDKALEEKHKELWARTYNHLGISPAGRYTIKASTGEVFEILDTDGDDDAEDRPVH